MARNEESHAFYNYQQNVSMHSYSWQQNSRQKLNQTPSVSMYKQHSHMQSPNNETYQQHTNDILNESKPLPYPLINDYPSYLQQNFKGYLQDDSVKKKGNPNDDSVTISTKIDSSNSSQVKNSRDRVKEYIEKGKRLRYRHPKVNKALKDKISLEELKNMGYHFIPEFDSSSGFNYKTLPNKEKLKPNEELGGYIFIANNDTFNEQIESKIFSKYNFHSYLY